MSSNCPCIENGSYKVRFLNPNSVITSFGISLSATPNPSRSIWNFQSHGLLRSNLETIQSDHVLTIDLSKLQILSFEGFLNGYVSYDNGVLQNALDSMTYEFDQKTKLLKLIMRTKSKTYSFNISIKDCDTCCCPPSSNKNDTHEPRSCASGQVYVQCVFQSKTTHFCEKDPTGCL